MDQPETSERMFLRSRRRQVHIWLSEREYLRVQRLAESHDETISGVLRRLLKEAGRPPAVTSNGPHDG
jgi:hypothetical protein